jgi:chromosome segregation ATPase
MQVRIGRMACGFGVLMMMSMAVSGCDYWPPALQAQIEQLQQEAQVANAERAKMIAQLNESNGAKQELQARVDDLTRSNRELTGRVSGLEQALVAERDKTSRLAKANSRPVSVKSVAKPAAKNTVKKKPVSKKRAA